MAAHLPSESGRRARNFFFAAESCRCMDFRDGVCRSSGTSYAERMPTYINGQHLSHTQFGQLGLQCTWNEETEVQRPRGHRLNHRDVYMCGARTTPTVAPSMKVAADTLVRAHHNFTLSPMFVATLEVPCGPSTGRPSAHGGLAQHDAPRHVLSDCYMSIRVLKPPGSEIHSGMRRSWLVVFEADERVYRCFAQRLAAEIERRHAAGGYFETDTE